MTLRSPESTLDLLDGALASHVGRLRALAGRARAGGDDALVHDVRVALRRVEATCRLFRGVPRKGDGDELRASARALRRRLSLLRSDEVGRVLLAARLAGGDETLLGLVFPAELPEARVGPGEISEIVGRLAAWRRRVAAAFDGPFAPRAAGEAVLLDRIRRRLRRRVAALSPLLPPGRRRLHRARIAAKGVRYALEVVEPLDPALRPLLRLLRAFQEAAGDAHDLVELAGRVRAAGSGTGPGLGALLVELDAEVARAFSAARRRGAALERPIRRLRAALGRCESR